MKFKIETAQLNKILAKVSKGVGNGKLLPVTQYLKVELKNRMLSITATDLNNFITGNLMNVSGDSGEILVEAEKLIRLANKTTVEFMEFVAEAGSINVKGNGKYKIPYIEGEFPRYEFNEECTVTEITNKSLQEMFKVNKSAIAITMEMPCLTGYNVGDMCITTDGIKMCLNKTNLVSNNMLISQELAELLTALDAEKISVQADGNRLLFKTDNVVIFGTELAGKDEYPDIKGILDFTYGNKVSVNKLQLLNALDRISLFVDQFDNFGVNMKFNEDGLKIVDMKDANYELVNYVDKTNFAVGEVTCNLPYLQGLLNVTPSETTIIEYNNDKTIRVTDGPIVQILSLMNVTE